jgi:predicted O-linked N-acetylglucosamine transferase (SPINDLY family)
MEGRRLQQLGLTLLDMGKLAESARELERASKCLPLEAQILCELGHVQEKLGRNDTSRETLLRAVKINPHSALALRLAASAQLNNGYQDEAVTLSAAAFAADPQNDEGGSNWMVAAIASDTVNADELRDIHIRYSQVRDAVVEFHPHAIGGSEKPRLKIAYYSNHFRRFPLTAFVPHVMRSHNREKFRVYALSSSGGRDEFTREYIDAVDEFHDLSIYGDDQAAQWIRSLGIDIIIDLSSYISGNRFQVLRRRPAPLQMSWLGYLATMGTPAIDYHLTDSAANPPGKTESLFTERLIRLPLQYCYSPSVSIQKHDLSPFEAKQKISFGVFSASGKLTDAAIACFIEILLATPGSSISMVIPFRHQQAKILRSFRLRGISVARVRFYVPSDPMTYFQRLAEVDIVLDSFPYVGGTVVCDAVWTGVPVVAMWLPRGFGGAAKSVLSAVGLVDLVAESAAEYVEKAVSLAQDLGRLKALHRGLRNQVGESALTRTGKMVDSLERAYRMAWDRRAHGLAPTHIDVS